MKSLTWVIAAILSGTTFLCSGSLASDRDRFNGQWNSVPKPVDSASLSIRISYKFQDGSYEKTREIDYKGTIVFKSSKNQDKFIISFIPDESFLSPQTMGEFRQKGDLLELLHNPNSEVKVSFEERFQTGNIYQVWRRPQKPVAPQPANGSNRFDGDWELVFKSVSNTVQDVVLSKIEHMKVNGTKLDKKIKFFEQGTFALNESTNPKRIDFYPEIRHGFGVFAGSSISEIYSFEESMLRIAHQTTPLVGGKSRRPLDFQPGPGLWWDVSELRKTP